mgnify:CR=1 FL=1
MKFITVFTPAYNRAYCLHRVYESLIKQTNQNFTWLIVDDGSTDNTKSLVQKWIAEQQLDIRYIYKANGGMHTAHNTAYKNIDTELNVCIDSDDFMPINAIQSIKDNWQKVKNNDAIAGLVGLDESIDGDLIGSKFKQEQVAISLSNFYNRQGGTGDKKLVLRTALTKVYPYYPEFSEERLVPLGTLYTLLERDYTFYAVNEVWAIVDYQQDGSSATIISQYFKSPKGFKYCREVNMKYGISLRVKFRNAIHYNVSLMILKEFRNILNNKYAYLTIPALPFSFLLYLYLLYRKI